MTSSPLRGLLPWTLLVLALLLFTLIILLPLSNIIIQAVKSIDQLPELLRNDNLHAAALLSLQILLWVMPLNLLFALIISWLLHHYRFRGRTFWLLSLDIPLVLSPMIAGIAFLLLFSKQQSLFGNWLTHRGIEIIFAPPGLVLVTLFVSFPYLAKELYNAMQQRGSLQEHAAWTLGANGWQIFFTVTLPALRISLLYGLIISLTRAIGEFGASAIVSGRIRGKTVTLPLAVQQLFEDDLLGQAFLLSSLLLLLALSSVLLRLAIPSQRH